MFQVLAINPSNSIKGTTVKVDFFGINWLNCGIDTTVIVDVSAKNVKIYEYILWIFQFLAKKLLYHF